MCSAQRTQIRDIRQSQQAGPDHAFREQIRILRRQCLQRIRHARQQARRDILSCAGCVVLLAAYFASRQPWLPKDAIGYAQGSTGILVLGAVDLSPLLLILAGLALVLAVFFTCRLIRKRKG